MRSTDGGQGRPISRGVLGSECVPPCRAATSAVRRRWDGRAGAAVLGGPEGRRSSAQRLLHSLVYGNVLKTTEFGSPACVRECTCAQMCLCTCVCARARASTYACVVCEQVVMEQPEAQRGSGGPYVEVGKHLPLLELGPGAARDQSLTPGSGIPAAGILPLLCPTKSWAMVRSKRKITDRRCPVGKNVCEEGRRAGFHWLEPWA